MHEEELEKLGLTKNESITYLTLLELGLSSAKPLIEKTGLHRQLIYNALDSLIKKGLTSYVIQANRKFFKAADPKIFGEYFEIKEKALNEQKIAFKKLLPELEEKSKLKKEEQEATIFKGNKGIKSLLDDMLNQKNEILTIGSSDSNATAFQYHLKFNLPKFHNIRQKEKILAKLLFSEELKVRAKALNNLKYTRTKILPSEFTSNSSTNIYGDKVSIIMWGNEPFGILIKSKDIAEAQRKHFNILWQIAKKL